MPEISANLLLFPLILNISASKLGTYLDLNNKYLSSCDFLCDFDLNFMPESDVVGGSSINGFSYKETIDLLDDGFDGLTLLIILFDFEDLDLLDVDLLNGYDETDGEIMLLIVLILLELLTLDVEDLDGTLGETIDFEIDETEDVIDGIDAETFLMLLDDLIETDGVALLKLID